MLDDRTITFLDIAGRETTPEGEALAAVRQFRKAVGHLDLKDVLKSPKTVDNGPPSLAKYKQTVSNLEGELEAVTLEKEALLSDNLNLTRQVKQMEKQLRERPQADVTDEPSAPPETADSFAAFERAATEKVGKTWRAVMHGQTRFSYTDFRNWDIDKKAPQEAFDALANLTNTKAAAFKWDDNPSAIARVFELKSQGVKTKTIASTLSSELGIELKPTAIKYCLQLKKP